MSTENNWNNIFPPSAKIERPVTLAVVDDHDGMREEICKILRSFGFTLVAVAWNGADLLNKLQELDEPPELCLMDISMPVMNGFETAVQLKRKYPQMKILAFSMDNDDDTIKKVLQCGADAFLEKNIPPTTLRDKLMELL